MLSGRAASQTLLWKEQTQTCNPNSGPECIACISSPDTVTTCMQVLGCAKGVLATVISVLLFRNPVTLLGGVGYVMTVFGVFAYGWAKSNTPKQ